MDLDVYQGPQHAACESIRHTEHHGREAKLKVDRGDKAALTTGRANTGCGRQIQPHWLLQQYDSTAWQSGNDIGVRDRRRGNVENAIRNGCCLRQRPEHTRNIPLLRDGLSLGAIDIENARYRQSRFPISRQVRVRHDATGAYNYNRTWRRRQRIVLPQIEAHRTSSSTLRCASSNSTELGTSLATARPSRLSTT
jgi:hypothetical protein